MSQRSYKLLVTFLSLFIVAGVVVIVVVLVNKGNDDGSSNAASSASTASGSCTRYRSASAAVVTFKGPGASSACEQFAQKFAASGGFWASSPSASTGESTTEICVLEREGLTLTVEDTNGGIYGTDVCSSFRGAGWTDVSG